MNDRRLDALALPRLLGGLVALLTLALPAAAQARPLSLSELNAFNVWVQCTEACGALPEDATFTQQREVYACRAACGNAARLWEKNGVQPIDRDDLELAILETQSAQQPPDSPMVCYRGDEDEVVVRGALCAEEVCQAQPLCTPAQCQLPEGQALDCTDDEPGGPRCWWPTESRPPACPDVVCDAAPSRDADACADQDQDGIPAWLEAHTGSSDAEAARLCGGLEACLLDERCGFNADLGAGQCQPRDCDDGCPLFRMEVISEDDQHTLVWIHYDHAAIPARVLDLYVNFDANALALEDARPLPALTAFGKQLSSAYLSDGTLRLSVLDPASTDPIAFGPIIELVFRRTAEESGVIAFSDDPARRRRAVAPEQGAAQDALAQDAWWGEGVELTPRSQLSTRLALWYGFDSLQSPISYANVPDAEALCGDIADCANEDDPQLRARNVALLARLQQGSIAASETIEGVVANGAYFNGTNDHLRLPVTVNTPYDPGEQHLTFSTWFYSEGNTGNELRDTPQILYSHNGFDERTRFGLLLRPNEDGGMDLAFFQGDFLSKTPPPPETLIAANIPLRTWHHVAFSLNATSGQVVLYHNGEAAGATTLPQPPAAIACPQLVNGTDIELHKEGEILGGRPTEFLYMGVARSGLYSIERMDLQGTQAVTVLGSGSASFRDPDYSPILDKLVYTSNITGDFEVWIANGDGSDPRQLTVGFGDSARNILARKPRWSPDGTAIVFESNAYDVLAFDNNFARVYHLYYISYDPVENAVAIELSGGGTASQLDYGQHVQAQTISLYRLTHGDMARNHTKAAWLEGRDDAAERRGVLLMETSSERFDATRIELVTVADNIPSTQAEPLEGLGEPGEELALLAAHRSVRPAFPQPIETRRLFYERATVRYEDDAQFEVTERANGDTLEVVVRHAPSDYDPMCWDTNLNALQDASEDANDDGLWDVNDCYPHDVRNLFVEYDVGVWRPRLIDDQGDPLTPGALLAPRGEGGVHKELQLDQAFPDGRAFVRVEILSPYNALPIPEGEVAVLTFERIDPGPETIPFGAIARRSDDLYFVKDLNSIDPPAPFVADGLLIEEALFSPDGDQLLLGAISNARPILLHATSLETAEGAARLSSEALRIRGLNWARQDNYYACNWVGGYLNPYDKSVASSLRGGLDDMKLYHGLRSPESLRSEVERGREYLDRDGQGEGDAPTRLATCGDSHADCPDYHLCVDSECVMVDCDPQDPYACNAFGGACVRRPASVEQEFADAADASGFFDWVCATDCVTDRQCFSQECLNGPCRYCETESLNCIECRYSETDFGAFTLAGIEGCPDRNSFACEDGACITECYAFDDGQSRYLCDPATEYCDQGRCVLLDWDWTDFAPASFGGLSGARYRLPPDVWEGYSAAVGERYTVEIDAYGVADYAQAPELVVEVKGGPRYGSDWARLGRIQIHNTTRADASASPVKLTATYPFDAMRVRMITPPYHNVTAAATGLRANDRDFCIADARASAEARGEDPALADLSPCYRRAPGSLANVGYRVGIPAHEAIAACRERGHAGCPSVAQGEHDFLYGGGTSVVVTDVRVAGGSVMNAIAQNTVCTYEGGLVPTDDGAPRKLYYGDITTEQSNQQAAFCLANPDACAAPSPSVVDFDPASRGFALLNCNLYDPADPIEGSAQLRFDGITIVREWPARAGAVVFDNGDTCRVELDALRSTPCYEWDTDASLDGYNAGTRLGATLEMGLFRGFGYDDGFTTVPVTERPLRVRVTGYTGEGLVLDNLGDRLAVDAADAADELAFPALVPEGRSYKVTVASQPSAPTGQTCRVLDPAQGRTPNANNVPEGTAVEGALVNVRCDTSTPLGGVVSGLSDGQRLLVRLTHDDEATGPQDLALDANGPFTFAPGIFNASPWTVSVVQHPRGQSCEVTPAQGEGAGAGVTVTCADLPIHNLSVAVAGLRGVGGLELVERVSGMRLTVNRNGRSDFPDLLPTGSAYDIAIVAQPASPAQLCALQGGQTGTTPDGDHVGALIECALQPTFAVTAPVTGLQGDGLTVTLNGGEETLTVPRPQSGLEAPVVTFARRLTTGASYRVEITQQPSAPDQRCQVYGGEGTIAFGDTTAMQIVCQPLINSDSYALQGTVSGLAGRDLVLINGFGTERVEIDTNGAFAFPQTVPDGTDYEVTIDRQPRDPDQSCRVIDGAGTVRGADITDIQVLCAEGSTVSLEINNASLEGASVDVRVYARAPEARLVGVSPIDARIERGVATFRLQAVGSSGPAVLTPETHDVIVMINSDGSVDSATGRATYSPADVGAARAVTLRSNDDNTVRFYSSDFAPLVAPSVEARAPLSVAEDAALTCLFAPHGAGPVALPEAPNNAVVARALRPCAEGDTCFDGSSFDDFVSATTTDNAPLPRGRYDITCFADEDSDDAADPGEHSGTLTNVFVSAQALVVDLVEVP